jgi:hypothetical protein
MTVLLVISPTNIPYIHRIYVVLANPTNVTRPTTHWDHIARVALHTALH